MSNEKEKISKNQFAELLYHWLSLQMTEGAIKESAKNQFRNKKQC